MLGFCCGQLVPPRARVSFGDWALRGSGDTGLPRPLLLGCASPVHFPYRFSSGDGFGYNAAVFWFFYKNFIGTLVGVPCRVVKPNLTVLKKYDYLQAFVPFHRLSKELAEVGLRLINRAPPHSHW